MLLVCMRQHPRGRLLEIAMSRIRLSAQRGMSGRGRVSAVAVYTDGALNSRLGIAGTSGVVLAVVSMPDGSVQLQWLEVLWRPVVVNETGPVFLGACKISAPVAKRKGAMAVLSLW